ncbi:MULTISPECIES: hypothetical protein [Streptomyces]|uniref:Uncharacterized protein n=1 Tax=Streptomyces tsukubensis (strain DSM 42081 / NBRC 108919 / NRRL 18488 / 9993) TaxID=1114943 RepID=I2N4X0_STRT9|nr:MULTISPECIES: hypothetical protein [Streptomyces]AZK96095.1 hypothetical protein B7R87_21185 [Streptomyces tsukubensis]EIF92067.1 lipoprotein [Streptomyces tsukubensis NRRL18488]MYS63768.1 hypothetical protein [Streptomyces sp. SID5473]QKM67887.1 hypothetical protein STSU_012600 [Streptomyces tsukubensis NRRL18488]TAI44281.1 hypothetical protein EWI31_12400 [Streptomyces tsukubensis]
MKVRRGIAALCLVIGVGLTAGGCSMPFKFLVAVWIGEDGKPVAEIRPCEGDRAYSLALGSRPDVEPATAGTPSGPVPDALRETSWHVGHRDGVTSAVFPLFSPPASWQVRARGPQELRPGYRYSLKFRSIEGRRSAYDARARFTAEDLAGLKPGEVWDGDAVTRKEFEERAEESC